jgi:plastocyanin
MRFHRLAMFVGAFAVVACGPGKERPPATDQPATPPAGAPATVGTATPATATGQTHVVRMVGDERGFRYEPQSITIRQGDAIRWEMISGAPHNVAFDPAQIPEPARAQINANMEGRVADLSSPMMMNVGENYTISFANVPAGTYPYFCTPHLAMGMTGTIVVQP